jgi:hypothetical protein
MEQVQWVIHLTEKHVYFTKENYYLASETSRNSCRDLLKGREILHLPCEYIVSYMDFTVNNQDKLHTNSAVHSIKREIKPLLQRQTTNILFIQKSTYHAGIKICNSLPNKLTSLITAEAKFKATLRQYFYTHSFHSVH